MGNQRRSDPADLPRWASFGNHYPKVARFTHADLKADLQKRRAWLEALIVGEISVVTEMPDTGAALTELGKLQVQIRPTFFGTYFDVRTQSD